MAGWCAIFVEKDENLPSDAVGSKEISLLTKNNPKNKIFDHIVMADLRHLVSTSNAIQSKIMNLLVTLGAPLSCEIFIAALPLL